MIQNRGSLKSSSAKVILTLTLLSLFVLPFQNCGPAFSAKNMASESLPYFEPTGSGDLIPATDGESTNCMTDSQYHACLFLKNPVAQKGSPISGAISSLSLNSLQTFGVKLTGLSSSGRLENGTISIVTLNGKAVDTSSLQKYKAFNDTDQRFKQVLTYYHLNRTIEYVGQRTGVFPAFNQGIKVYVDDSIAGWSAKYNSIHLKDADNGNSMAWSPELSIHFLGLANAHHASSGKISDLSSSQAVANHAECGLKPFGCCKTQAGCARAIASGVGDYFAAMMFPNKPIVGETWANEPAGITNCSLSRNLNSAKSRMASTAFAACSSNGMPGEIHTMGTVYASIWWQVRQSAGQIYDKDLDTLFMKHLSVLDGSDTFRTALEKIKKIDQTDYSGRFSGFFESEFQARGL